MYLLKFPGHQPQSRLNRGVGEKNMAASGALRPRYRIGQNMIAAWRDDTESELNHHPPATYS